MQVSIIIPVRDGEEFIAQTIRSALNQSLPPLEILVVDNGSTDKTVPIARSFGDPVRVLHEPAPGASRARLTGVSKAGGEALMFLDADDLLGPTALEELAKALESRPGSVACCPWQRYEEVNGCWRAVPSSCRPRETGEDPLTAWLSGWYYPPCSVLWSRGAYRTSGGWDPEISVDDDGDVMMRALAAGVHLEETAGGTAYYRRLPNGQISLSGRRFTSVGLDSRLTVINKIEDALIANGRIEQYRLPLRRAFLNIADDAKSHEPEIAKLAIQASNRNSEKMPRKDKSRVGKVRNRNGSKNIQSFPPAPSPDRPLPIQDEPLVSVIIPTFNRCSLTCRAIDSVLAQDFKNIELLVIDDCSTDQTVAAVQAYTDQRLRLIRQSQNSGVAAARNRGIREARGSLIAFLDSDDVWLPQKLDRQVHLVNKRPHSVGLFYTGLVVDSQNGRDTWSPHARGNVLREILHTNVVHFGTSSVLVRREVFDTVGLFDETMPANEDHELWTRIATFFELDFTPEPLIIYNHKDADHTGVERRSRNFAANMRARLVFLDLHGEMAKRLGVKHLYHLDCARRHLESPHGQIWQARRHLAAAAHDRPHEVRFYAWLLLSLMPLKLRSKAQYSISRIKRLFANKLTA